VATKTNANATLHERAIHELKEFAILAVYLYITIGAVILMKTAVLHTRHRHCSLGHRRRQGRRSWPNSCCSATQ
jgi:hypothetical protein